MPEQVEHFQTPKPVTKKVVEQPQHQAVKHGKPLLPWKRKAELINLIHPELRELYEAVYKMNPHSTESARLLSIISALGERAFFYSGRDDKFSLDKKEYWNNGSSVVSAYKYEMNLAKVASTVRGYSSVYFRNVGVKEILESDLSDPEVVSRIVEKWCLQN